MKQLPAGMQDHLDSGSTTLSWCWRLTRTDGVVMGFTDHDDPITFDDTTFEAQTGLTGSELQAALGLSVNQVTAAGGLDENAITEADILAGLFDNAAVEVFRVNWQSTEQRVLVTLGNIGEVTRGQTAFEAEFRSLAHYLNAARGRLHSRLCDADLGDARCGVDLTSSQYRATGTIAAIVTARQTFTTADLAAYDTGWFARGRLEMTSGEAQGQAFEVRTDSRGAALSTLSLWLPSTVDLQPGDTFVVTAGCDKRRETCRDKFSNIINRRATGDFMPGNDSITAPIDPAGEHDGGSLFR